MKKLTFILAFLLGVVFCASAQPKGYVFKGLSAQDAATLKSISQKLPKDSYNLELNENGGKVNTTGVSSLNLASLKQSNAYYNPALKKNNAAFLDKAIIITSGLTAFLDKAIIITNGKTIDAATMKQLDALAKKYSAVPAK